MTRLFILSRVYAAELTAAPDAPRSGDVVALFRQAQDADGSTIEQWRRDGVTVVMAEFLVELEEGRAIDATVQPACYSWHVINGKDVSIWNNISIGEILTPYLWIEYNILYLIRAGIIFKRLLTAYPLARDIITDVVDNYYYYQDKRQLPGALPWRQILQRLASDDGRTCIDLPSSLLSVPSISLPAPRLGFLSPPTRLLDRFHPRRLPQGWRRLSQAITSNFRQHTKPLVYLFALGHLNRVATALARYGTVSVVANHDCGAGVAVMRHQDGSVQPDVSLWETGQRLRSLVDRLDHDGIDHPAFQWEGIDFGPWVVSALRHLLLERLPDTLQQIAQLTRLIERLRPQAVVLSTSYGAANAVITGLRRQLGYRHYFINHAHDYTYGFVHNGAVADPEMTYISEGEDHLKGYGYAAPGSNPPRRVTLANPAETVCDYLRKRKSKTRRQTVLALNYNCCTPHSVIRSGYVDQYLIDIITVGKQLYERGIRTIYRGHPSENKIYARELIRALNAADFISIDDGPSFEWALLKCDVLICNTTTCYYVALAAGWPTIFHEPGYDPQDFFGLPAAEDTGRPLSKTPAALLAYLLAAYDPDSEVARFPARFSGPLAGRFFNATSLPPDQAIAKFLLEEMSLKRPPGGSSD